MKDLQKQIQGGFPGGAVVENLPANAGDTGSSPGLGRSHMPRSDWAHEPQLLSLRVWSLCSAMRGHDSERPPLAATRESPRTETKTQHSQKSINHSTLPKKKKLKKTNPKQFWERELCKRKGSSPAGKNQPGQKVSFTGSEECSNRL